MDVHQFKTFEELASIWLDAKKKTVKHSTFCAYSLTLNIHLLPMFAKQTAIYETQVQTLVDEKISAGISVRSVKDMVATLKNIVKFGSKHFGLNYVDWELVYPKELHNDRPHTLSLSSERKLLRYLFDNLDSRNIGILLALYTGMRIGEICALRWEDVNMMERVVTVSKTFGRIYNVLDRATEQIVSTPKSKSSFRDIPIAPDLFAALRRLRKHNPTAIYVVGCKMSPKEPRTLRDYYNRLLRRLNISKVVFHGLRHTFATRCIEGDCDYKTVSSLLGHSNVTTTLNLYVHPTIDQKRKAINKISKIIAPLKS